MASKLSKDSRPTWPRRAIVTAGMPYGNKNLHFGHVGGVFIPADFYARFLRDRIGFYDIYGLIEKSLAHIPFIAAPSFDDYVATNSETRAYAESLINEN